MEYVFGDNIVNDKNILQCLEYLSQSNIQEAKLIAQKQLDLGDIGKFSNEGKGFFEWILYHTGDGGMFGDRGQTPVP